MQRNCSPLNHADIFYRGDLSRIRKSNLPQARILSIESLLVHFFPGPMFRTKKLWLFFVSTCFLYAAAGGVILHLAPLAISKKLLSGQSRALLLGIIGAGRAVGQLILALVTLMFLGNGLDRILIYGMFITGCGLATFCAPLLDSFLTFTLFAGTMSPFSRPL